MIGKRAHEQANLDKSTSDVQDQLKEDKKPRSCENKAQKILKTGEEIVKESRHTQVKENSKDQAKQTETFGGIKEIFNGNANEKSNKINEEKPLLQVRGTPIELEESQKEKEIENKKDPKIVQNKSQEATISKNPDSGKVPSTPIAKKILERKTQNAKRYNLRNKTLARKTVKANPNKNKQIKKLKKVKTEKKDERNKVTEKTNQNLSDNQSEELETESQQEVIMQNRRRMRKKNLPFERQNEKPKLKKSHKKQNPKKKETKGKKETKKKESKKKKENPESKRKKHKNGKAQKMITNFFKKSVPKISLKKGEIKLDKDDKNLTVTEKTHNKANDNSKDLIKTPNDLQEDNHEMKNVSLEINSTPKRNSKTDVEGTPESQTQTSEEREKKKLEIAKRTRRKSSESQPNKKTPKSKRGRPPKKLGKRILKFAKKRAPSKKKRGRKNMLSSHKDSQKKPNLGKNVAKEKVNKPIEKEQTKMTKNVRDRKTQRANKNGRKRNGNGGVRKSDQSETHSELSDESWIPSEREDDVTWYDGVLGGKTQKGLKEMIGGQLIRSGFTQKQNVVGAKSKTKAHVESGKKSKAETRRKLENQKIKKSKNQDKTIKTDSSQEIEQKKGRQRIPEIKQEYIPRPYIANIKTESLESDKNSRKKSPEIKIENQSILFTNEQPNNTILNQKISGDSSENSESKKTDTQSDSEPNCESHHQILQSMIEKSDLGSGQSPVPNSGGQIAHTVDQMKKSEETQSPIPKQHSNLNQILHQHAKTTEEEAQRGTVQKENHPACPPMPFNLCALSDSPPKKFQSNLKKKYKNVKNLENQKHILQNQEKQYKKLDVSFDQKKMGGLISKKTQIKNGNLSQLLPEPKTSSQREKFQKSNNEPVENKRHDTASAIDTHDKSQKMKQELLKLKHQCGEMFSKIGDILKMF